MRQDISPSLARIIIYHTCHQHELPALLPSFEAALLGFPYTIRGQKSLQMTDPRSEEGFAQSSSLMDATRRILKKLTF